MKQTQGARANSSGRFGEDIIASTLALRGYYPIKQHTVGLSIFKTTLKVDFYLPVLPLYPNGLVIESKRQESSGSVDEKVCFVIENIRARCYPCPVMIVAGGKGARDGSIAWLRRQVDGFFLIAVYDLEEFASWCMTL